ncbi:TonB-dependent receptor [Duganella sp. FT135W]|uniref:TonB-dependent receptor n=1 Tax=Duganella flavida TaxID=2692175 RepID=A0A6L8K6S0_9BURK|nr:TonB-dependent receptor [Duganella flavida]MYM21888.1 TonB-dependent receptor [Duganella flavida]
MMMETVLSRSLRVMFAGSAALMLAQPAFAQDAPIQRVEITGSAIKRIDAETAVPVTVVKMADLKKEGITTVEQVLANLSVSQSQQGTSQVVGLGTGGASFANLRGIGANKTLILLNGRRLANNAFDSSAPDLNMIPFAALERVEVLRDGASSLYGSDAVGGVINFITKKDYQGGTVTLGADNPQHDGGFTNNANIGYGWGDLDKNGFNIFAMVDHQEQHRIGGTQRDFNTRYPGGLSGSTFPANYYQTQSANPAGPGCTTGSHLISAGDGSCLMTTSSFVDYIPKSERTTGLVKGTFKINENHELGVEFLSTQSKVQSAIAPVPYGGLYINRLRPDGSLNPYYPGNGSTPAAVTLDPTYMDTGGANTAGVQPGFVHAKWRDLPNGSRADENINKQQRLVVELKGIVAGWDYQTAVSYNENKVTENLYGYSDGGIITKGVLDGVINVFGDQSAAGTALLNSAALSGNIMNAKGTSKGADFKASREVGDWLNAGHEAALAVGAQYEHQEFRSAANAPFAEKVIASTGIDPATLNAGTRNVSAFFSELNLPVLKNLDLTAAFRYDKYSDFGHTFNPKFAFTFRPVKDVLLRGSYSKGFRAPSLYEINAQNTYTNSGNTLNDPVNCPGGTPIPGKSAAANCKQQFQVLNGGNANLNPERSKTGSLGVVWEPINNLSLEATWWSIRMTQQISHLQDFDVLTDPATFASYYHRNAAGDLATDGSQCPNPVTCGYIDLRNQNLGDVNTNGVDLSATYKLRTKDFGTFTFSDNATWVHKYEYQNFIGDVMHQNVGVFSGSGVIFRWQNTANLNWTQGKFGAGLTAHYKTGYQDQPVEDHPDHRVASYSTFDGYASWEAIKSLTLTAGVRNLFDKEPPLSYQATTFQAGYDPRYTDPVGRTLYVRATYNF